MNSKVWILVLIALIFFIAMASAASKSKAANKSKVVAKSGAAKSKVVVKSGAAKSKAAGSKAANKSKVVAKSGAAKTKAAGSKAGGSKAGGSKAAGSKAAPKPYLNTRLIGMRGRKTGLVIKHVIRNVGTVPVTGVASSITIGTLYQFYQFKNHSEKMCKYASNVVSCTWATPLAPKAAYKSMFLAAPKTLVKDEQVAAASKVAAKSKAKTAASKSKAANKSKAAGSKAAGSKAAGSKAAGSKAAAVSTVVTQLTGWKATVTATNLAYPVSAPLVIRPKPTFLTV